MYRCDDGICGDRVRQSLGQCGAEFFLVGGILCEGMQVVVGCTCLGFPRAMDMDEALTHAIRRCRGPSYKAGQTGPWMRRDEPLWWRPGTLLNALDEIGASNYQQVSAAVSVSPGALMYLHTFRNFYAHRSKETRIQIIGDLRHLQFPTTYTATMALSSPTVGSGSVRPQALLLDWPGRHARHICSARINWCR